MDVFKPFLQRLSQPILLSFCIAWVVWNWEIVIALCWYDAKNIENLGFKNHIDYINTMKDHWRNYWWPLIIAILYPFTILILNNFHTFFKMLEEKLFTKIVKNATVPTDLYLDAQDQIEAKEKRISKFISLETKMEGQINDLKIEKKDLDAKLASLNLEHIDTKARFVDSEEKLDLANKELTSYNTKSNINYILGKYELELLERHSRTSNLSIFLEAILEINYIEEQNLYLLKLEFENCILESEITTYFYNILENKLIFNAVNFKKEYQNLSENDIEKIKILENELMDGFICLSESKNFTIFRKNIMYNKKNLRLDLKLL